MKSARADPEGAGGRHGTLSLFQRGDNRPSNHRPAHVRNLFKRGEPLTICKTALAAKPEGVTTRELAVACLAAREFDHEDPVLVRAMVGAVGCGASFPDLGGSRPPDEPFVSRS